MWKEALNNWLAYDNLQEDLRNQLTDLKFRMDSGDSDAEELLEDMFYRELSFGTGGLRGELGPGSNRMNKYSVEKTIAGLASYLNKYKKGGPVAIGYDSRIMSREFSEITAQVLNDSGMDVYLYDALMPAPALSFATRYKKCKLGIMITASHNPSSYNGCKVYDERGCQVTEKEADLILEEINRIPWFQKVESKAKGKLHYLGQETKEAYYQAVIEESTGVNASNLSVVYTPLNGAGLIPVKEIFNRIGVCKYQIVREQEEADGNFPTCPYPNPEKKEALLLGLELAAREQADILLGTDPDCDRVGIGVRHQGEYILPSGNEIGVLLADYISMIGEKNEIMPENPLMVRTIVTSPLLDKVCESYGIRVETTLTGFKYIGEKIGKLEDLGRVKEFIFGFEESYGYLKGSYVRDKDGVNGVMLICEMAAYYKREGKTLIDRINEIYEKHGYRINKLLDFQFPGPRGMEQMSSLLKGLRDKPITEVSGNKVLNLVDYLKDTGLPASDVLEFHLEKKRAFTIRPSGTEPKLKIYIFGNGETREETENFLKEAEEFFEDFMRSKQ